MDRTLELDLTTREYLVKCRQDSHVIAVVPSKESATNSGLTAVRCTVCNRPLPEENLEEVIALSERGKRLTDGSRWMQIWITEMLWASEPSPTAVKWNAETAGDEIDIILADLGKRVFFELKDREFGLGDAYPFRVRLDRYGADIGIVATTDKVASDAKTFFAERQGGQRTMPTEMVLLEGRSQVEEGIPKLVDNLRRAEASSIIEGFCGELGLNLWPFVNQWINAAQVASASRAGASGRTS